MKTVTTHHAKTHLSRILKEVQSGEEIIILSGHTPVGRLVAVEATNRVRPTVGSVTSDKVICTPDAFAPLDSAALREWGL